MDYLVLSPPVCTPSEPPSGAFTLASALSGWGFETGLFDLSLAFFRDLLRTEENTPGLRAALSYLGEGSEPYEPQRHRGATGVLHRVLKTQSERYPGWRLTLMDVEPPFGLHSPLAALEAIRQPGYRSPFTELYRRELPSILQRHRPRQVLISLAYLSQLPAAIELDLHLSELGIQAIVGGSLPTSMEQTADGLTHLREVFSHIVTGDGGQLTGLKERPLTERLAWPQLLGESRYLSRKEIIPLPLSTGCYWRQCMFCPDRDAPYRRVDLNAVDNLFRTAPKEVIDSRPVVHLLDSAVPPGQLRQFLPLAVDHNLEFYGFARPTKALLADNLIEQAAESGCLMLQLGAESGNGALLDRFHKGINPTEAQAAIRSLAASGIRNYVYLLFGLPGETNAERLETQNFVANNHDHIDFLNCSLFNLPRHCELTDRADEFDIELLEFSESEHIKLYRPFNVAGTDVRRDARRFLTGTFGSDPRVKAALKRTPRWLRAAHLALMGLDNRRTPIFPST